MLWKSEAPGQDVLAWDANEGPEIPSDEGLPDDTVAESKALEVNNTIDME